MPSAAVSWSHRALSAHAAHGHAIAAALIVFGLLAAGPGSAATSVATSGSLVFGISGSAPGPGLYRLDLASHRLTRITRQPHDQSPAWSRGGNQIAFIRGEYSPLLFVVRSDGTGAHSVGHVIATSAAWGPGDREIAFGDIREKHDEILTVPSSGGKLQLLYRPSIGTISTEPSWGQ